MLYCVVLYCILSVILWNWNVFTDAAGRYWLDGTAASCCIVKVPIQRSILAFTQAAKHWWIKLPIIWMWGSHSVYPGFLLAACFHFYCTMLLQNIVIVQVIDRKDLASTEPLHVNGDVKPCSLTHTAVLFIYPSVTQCTMSKTYHNF